MFRCCSRRLCPVRLSSVMYFAARTLHRKRFVGIILCVYRVCVVWISWIHYGRSQILGYTIHGAKSLGVGMDGLDHFGKVLRVLILCN